MKQLIAVVAAFLLAAQTVPAHAQTSPDPSEAIVQSTEDGAPSSVITTPTLTPQVAYESLRGQLVYILRLRLLGLRTGDQQVLTTTSGQLEVFEEDILENFDWDQSALGQALHTAVTSARTHPNNTAALQSDLDTLQGA